MTELSTPNLVHPYSIGQKVKGQDHTVIKNCYGRLAASAV